MLITTTEFKTNLNKYLLLASTEDIYITRYGKTVAKLTTPFQSRMEVAESLFGAIPQKTTVEDAMDIRAN